ADDVAKLFVLNIVDAAGEIAIGAIPEGIDAKNLDIDAVGIHLRGPAVRMERADQRLRLTAGAHAFQGGPFQKRDDLRNETMAMHVDGFDALAADDDLPPR